jgi:hypothetical protein
MIKYQYQETLIIKVEVYAESKNDAQDKVASALGIALSSMKPLDTIEQDIRDNSFDSIEISVSVAD